MIKLAIALGTVFFGVAVSATFAADRVTEAGSLSPANNGSAIAAVKAENSTRLGSDAANSQLGSRDDASALGVGKSATIGSHAYSAAPDDGAIKKGVLNVRIDASALAADPQIGGATRLSVGSGNAAQQVDAHDVLK